MMTAIELERLIRERCDVILEEANRVDVGVEIRVAAVDEPDDEPDVVILDLFTTQLRVIRHVQLMPTRSAPSPTAAVDTMVLEGLDNLDALNDQFGASFRALGNAGVPAPLPPRGRGGPGSRRLIRWDEM